KRILIKIKEKKKMMYLDKKIKQKKLNVRQVEKLIQNLGKKAEEKPKKTKHDIFLQERESFLQDKFGTSVKINRGKRKGKIEIEFYTDEDLNRIIDVLEK